MTQNELLEKAIIFATQKHAGQTRWNGEPYILHPLRVMTKCTTMKTKILAVLHDVIEDTTAEYTDLLRMGFSTEYVNPLSILTHQEGYTYKDYVLKISNYHDRDVVIVKIADLEDNTNIFENPGDLDNRYMRSLNKHLRALRYLKYGGLYDG